MQSRVRMLHVSITMIQIANYNHIMTTILVQLLMGTVIHAAFWPHSNVTSNDLVQKSDRLKRAPFHRYIPSSILTATIVDGDKVTHLTWKRVNRFLFNKHLPIYTAQLNSWGPTHKRLNVMEKVGEAITYYDIEHKSAMIYLENLNKLYGVVGRSYRIVHLPIDELSKPLIVEGPYVKNFPFQPHRKKTLKNPSARRRLDFGTKRRRLNDDGSSTSSIEDLHNDPPEQFFIETLLLVTYDIFLFFRGIDDKTTLLPLISSYLLHWNAVDMVFADLPVDEFEIYINLAGIVVEEEDGVFSEMIGYPPLKYDNRRQLHLTTDFFNKFDFYTKHFDFPFPRDSFDFIFVSTSRELHRDLNEPADRSFNWNAVDIFDARKYNDSYLIVPMAIAQSFETYHSFCVTAREIGTILGISIDDPPNKDITENGIQCYGIMQGSKYHCSQCLRWSDESINQLRIFLNYRKNRNRCWFLNKPRSLLPMGTPLVSLSPCRQCSCFGYDSYGEEMSNECPLFIPAGGCVEPLQCKRRNSAGSSELEPTILPFDGTPCGHKKVCWGEVCKGL